MQPLHTIRRNGQEAGSRRLGPGNCRRHVVAAFVKLKIKSCAKTRSGFLIHSEIRHPTPVCEIQPLNLLSCHRERPFERSSQPTPPDKGTSLEACAQQPWARITNLQSSLFVTAYESVPGRNLGFLAW